MKKKKYSKPTVSIVELNPEQAVLAACKQGVTNVKQNNPLGGCKNNCKKGSGIPGQDANHSASS